MKFNIQLSLLSKSRFSIMSLVFVVLPSVCFKSVSQQINFKHININNGLSQNAVFAIMKDSRGFMWFGTKDGLNKYNGYNFVIYQHNPFDSATLSTNYITSLFEDSRGLIWVGTFDRELISMTDERCFSPNRPGRRWAIAA
jgi:ligand-binding sensor domain-containing protein